MTEGPRPSLVARADFRVHYQTRWGERLLLERKVARAGDSAVRTDGLPMRYAGNGFWRLEIKGLKPGNQFEYRYIFEGLEKEVRREPAFRRVRIEHGSQVVLDQWLPAEMPDWLFLRQAFAGIIFRPDCRVAPATPACEGPCLRLTVRAPRVMPGCRVCVSGNHPRLGDWDPGRVVLMGGENYPLWETELPLRETPSALEYKFGLWNERTGKLISLEDGPPRRLEGVPHEAERVLVNAEHFRHRTLWKGAGVAIPVFSLRSERGYGIGEFADLEPLAEWAAECGLRMVQVLPVNDTTSDYTWTNSYPYRAISTAALHPVYINIEKLHREYRLRLPPRYLARRETLNSLPQLDYESVLNEKLEYLRWLYSRVGARTLSSGGFRVFWHSESEWLIAYAAFCLLRDRYGTADFSKWGEHAIFREEEVRRWFDPHAREYWEVMFHCFVQYHLKRQLDRALAVGRARGIAFKGDLPIGIDRCSVEAWTQPELFHMDRQTGAPPDSFSAMGQNWGFPTYNWQRMQADGYAWWRRRFHRMSACFDALRIDHILGFFRMWEIPLACSEGILGHFNPALAMSPEEIRRSGFGRDPAKFSTPTIAEGELTEFFGEHATKVAREILQLDRDALYRPRPEFAQSEARRKWCAAAFTDEKAAGVAEGLTRLEYEVLFLEDPDQPGRYHPRIALEQTAIFRSLEESEQAALRQLHDEFFYRQHTRFWEQEAMKKLPALVDATDMLICGEDLGMIPDAVPVVLKRLGLLSLEVQSMPKRLGQKIGNPRDYPYLSVCTTSTHDTPTLRGIWEEDTGARQEFHTQVLGREGAARSDCTPEIARVIIEQTLAGASMWCILPLQDWLALDANLRHPVAAAERINVPANPRNYWRYRMHLTIAQLRKAGDFGRLIRRLVVDSGRLPPC